jgi:hypothetical protein
VDAFSKLIVRLGLGGRLMELEVDVGSSGRKPVQGKNFLVHLFHILEDGNLLRTTTQT